MIDADKKHRPEKGPALVAAAIEAVGSQKELASRAGVSPEYLRLIARGKRKLSYPLQVVLEQIAACQTEH